MRKYLAKDRMVSSEYIIKKENRFRVETRDGRKFQRSRYIMAKFLFAKDLNIPQSLSVHHIDGDTSNDELNNLSLMRHDEHNRMHMFARPHKYGVSLTLDPVEYQKRCYSANKEKMNARSLSWRNRHREEIREYNRKYKLEHKDEIRQYKKEYCSKKKNEGVVNA